MIDFYLAKMLLKNLIIYLGKVFKYSKKTIEAFRDIDFDKAKEVLKLEEEVNCFRKKEYRTKSYRIEFKLI